MQQKSGYTEGRVDFKAGKLIRIRAKFRDDKIEDIRITGDFYIYPEDSIELLEEKLKGARIGDVDKIINEVLEGAEYIGIDSRSLSMAVREAWTNRK